MIQYLSYWLWLAVSVLVYWRLPERWRAPFLAAVCIGFLTAYVPKTVALMLPICLAVYVMTNLRFLSERRSFAVRGSVALLLFYLAWFKYFPVIGQAINEMMTVYAADVTPGYASAATILIPLGISYFTFKLIHYAIERTRGTLPVHGPADYLSYVFLVPIFTAGPIERFEHYLGNREKLWSNHFAIEGLTRIGHGLIKKFVIGALIFALIQNITQGGGSAWLLDNLQGVNPLRVLAFLTLTYLYIYMDFAGYTDIALGCSRLFGLRIMENFNMPFLAPNIGNVWKRWHMTLAHWCQTYVYMPMIGITRNPYFAVLVSCTAMGLWHAASLSWLCWGLYNGIGVMILQKFSALALRRRWKFVKTPTWKLVRYPITFFFFSCSFAFAATATTGGVWGGVRLLAKLVGLTLPG